MQMLRHLMQGQAVSGDGYTLVESPLIVRESTAPLTGSNGHNPAGT